MNKILETPDGKTMGQNGNFIPLTEFYEISNYRDLFPYPTSFSLQPLRENLKGMGRPDKKSCELDLEEAVDTLEELLAKGQQGKIESSPEFAAFLEANFPFLFFEGQRGFISIPFIKEYLYVTPAMRQQVALGEWEIKIPNLGPNQGLNHMVTSAGSLLLNTFYGQSIQVDFPEVLTLRHLKTGLHKHYKVNIVKDYILCKASKPPKKLSEKQIFELFNAWDDADLWLQHLPPDNFAFEGFIIGYLSDVTDVTILSQLKEMIVMENWDDDPYAALDLITQQVRSFLGLPDIQFGNLLDPDSSVYKHGIWSIIGLPEVLNGLTKSDYAESPYNAPVNKREPAIIPDLVKEDNPGKIGQILIDQGFRSLLLIPVTDSSGQFLGVFELASPNPYEFSKRTLFELQELVSVFTLGTANWLRELETATNVFIQKQFTSIHPSVEWKFREVTQNFLWSQESKGEAKLLEPIRFKDVYPLYGQADIVGSSGLRNEAIIADMSKNLELLSRVIKDCLREIDFPLLEMDLDRVEEKQKLLGEGKFTSSDESLIMDWLTQEIHPLLQQLSARFPERLEDKCQTYFDALDPELEVIYRQRKAYEDSVSQLNHILSTFLEEEDQKMQELLPHYFEKYTTDGIEFNIYLGQSLLKNERFSDFFLKDFRLWQLILMCKITRLVAQSANKLSIPLSTAQLVFVYNTPLSIHFYLEEKQFDVDGAYNVRYEILKKRIDKALIKGTKERIRQPGKIAIVYLHDKDKLEYMTYLRHLVNKEFIEEEIEELQLEKLQGAEGLKALRVTVT